MASTVIRFLCHAFGDGLAHDDSLLVSTRFRHRLFPRYAWRLEKPPSAHPLLAHFHAGHTSRTQDLTGNDEVDTGCHHSVALFAVAQSQLLERPSDCQLDGSRPDCHAASAKQSHHLSHWRWEPGGQTWGQKSRGSERPKKQVPPLVFRYPFRVADRRLGWVSHPGGLSPHFAQASSRLSQRKCAVSRDGQGVHPAEMGDIGNRQWRCRLWLQGQYEDGQR